MTHVPVLLAQALEFLAVRPDGIYVDATFGGGGHAHEILERLTSGRLIAIDLDPAAQPKISHPSVSFVHDNFRNLHRLLDELGIAQIDGALFDLGVSSMQFDRPERGFSFREAGPIDMRMNRCASTSAYDILSTATESELADIFYRYGQERASRRLAHAVVLRREAGTLPKTTTEFASFVSGVLHRSGRRERIHPATRIFQALRIAVNDELDSLREGLLAAANRLRSTGRIVAISFHSLEDRIVKNAFRDDRRLNVLTRKPVVPTDDEIADNPRARSAKLRAAERKAG
ncbi:MAG: 16S rRNA (cytosine(1402)-N(4))-methyltransferase RsmH [Candidatus Eremiobacteraeota bacterium]|nr:16S rRNA (cytosine(1402)-N(4))-methyltransferase RsmH [Candidatus Eremiobacteraeota bacterium]